MKPLHDFWKDKPLCVLFFGLLGAAGGQALAVNLTEIHYDPPLEDAGLEFLEIANDSPTVVDLSGYSFIEGVSFTFPPGSFVAGRSYVVLCGNESAFKAAYPDVPVAGVFVGRLDSDGETIVLANGGGGEVLRVDYSDRGKWPSIPAGTGHTLSLKRPHLDAGEPENWAPSLLPGGTPGALNFPTGAATEVEIIRVGDTWSYKKGTEEFSIPMDAWRQPAYSTAGWLTGPSGIGYGDGDDATVLSDMPNGYLSVAMRRTFLLSAEVLGSSDSFVLGVNYDDGFVAYINGTEVARGAMNGAAGSPVPYNATGVVHEAGAEEQFPIPKSVLAAGSNVMAIQGHNTSLGSSDFSLAPRVLRLVPPSTGTGGIEVAFNEFLGRTSGSRWVEIFNRGKQAADLSGSFLTDTASSPYKYRFPAGTTIPPREFLVVTEALCGLDFSTAEVRLFLTLPDRSAVVAGEIFENVPQDGRPGSRAGYSDARVPDGTGRFGFAATPTPGEPNDIQVNQDIVINEILYHPPPGNTAGKFIELYNKGAASVDLGGWAFTKGISFGFPQGTTLAAGGYLVVAKDPTALGAAHSLAGVLGPWTGTLSGAGENIRLVDTVGNTVDEVRYHDGGRWSPWADGGGSSLELIDPYQDNSFPTAWDASDESAKSPWTQITYTGSYVAEAESEFHFLLLDGGVVHVDDVHLTRSGSPTEYVANGTFETGTSPWRFGGTHVSSQRVATDAHSGTACLEIVATGGGDNGVNKVETDTAQTMSSGTFTVSFWGRWIRGANRLLSRADARTTANLSRSTALPIPQALGTPGRENSARLALKAEDPGGNLGPVIADVVHSPASPTVGTNVTVKARARDSDGMESLTVHYRTGSLGDGTFTAVPMLDDGLSGDGEAGDGLFAAVIPAQAQGTRVLFFVEGIDDAGAARRFPVEAPEKTLLYAVEGPAQKAVHVVRLNLDGDNEAELGSRFLHSDDLVDGSFVLDDEEVYYNVGVRYHGSPWNRPPDPKMYRVRFNEDRPFLHDLKAVNLSRYGNAQNEGAAYLCVQSTSRPTSPGPVGDYRYARVYHNTGFHGSMAIVETVDNKYIDKWFPADPGGLILKIPGNRFLDDSGALTGADWTTFAYRGSMTNFEHERYRWYFNPGSRQVEDIWGPLVDLCTAMDVNRTPVSSFDAAIVQILDVEQFLRVEAARTLQDDWDTIGIGNGQNAYIYYAPLEKRWKLLPWDMDHTFGNASAKLYPEGSEAQITRLVQRPAFRRIYLRIVEQLLGSAWDPTYMGPYLTQTQAGMGVDGSAILNFINARRASVLAMVPSSVVFKLTSIGSTSLPTGWNKEHMTTKASETVRGTAPVNIATISFVRNGEPVDVPLTWTTFAAWSAVVPFLPNENRFDLYAFNDTGDLLDVYSFLVIQAVDWDAPVVASLDPTSGTSKGGTSVRILGDNFHPGARVYFGGVESEDVIVTSLTEIEAVTPAGTGIVPVSVTNLDSQTGALGAAFRYIEPPRFVRGDVSLDGEVDIGDAVKILLYAFLGGELPCLDAADADNSGEIDVSDPVRILNFLFLGGPAPAAPFPGPGEDPVSPVDYLGCATEL